MKEKIRYKQPHNLTEYDSLVRDRVHNAMKHKMSLKKYQTYLRPMSRHANNHNKTI